MLLIGTAPFSMLYLNLIINVVRCVFFIKMQIVAKLQVRDIYGNHDDVIKWKDQSSALLALCVGNLPVTGEVPARKTVTLSFGISFDLRPNKRWRKQLWGWWFETQSQSSWRHRNDVGEWCRLDIPCFVTTLMRCVKRAYSPYWCTRLVIFYTAK